MLPLALGGYRPLTREEMNNLHKNINEGCIDWTDDFYRQETCPATGKVINYGLALRISVEIEDAARNHDRLDSFPLFPEKISLTEADLSPFQRRLNKKLNVKHISEKILLTLAPKSDCTVDYRYLQFSLRLGYRVVHIKEAYEYRQSPFLAPYIEKNCELRRKSSNQACGSLFTLLNNCIYGR